MISKEKFVELMIFKVNSIINENELYDQDKKLVVEILNILEDYKNDQSRVPYPIRVKELSLQVSTYEKELGELREHIFMDFVETLGKIKTKKDRVAISFPTYMLTVVADRLIGDLSQTDLQNDL